MILSKEEICRWANTSDSKRNFKEGERIINAGHIIYSGKNIEAYIKIFLCTAITIDNTTIYLTIFSLTRRKTNSCHIYLVFLQISASTQ